MCCDKKEEEESESVASVAIESASGAIPNKKETAKAKDEKIQRLEVSIKTLNVQNSVLQEKLDEYSLEINKLKQSLTEATDRNQIYVNSFSNSSLLFLFFF